MAGRCWAPLTRAVHEGLVILAGFLLVMGARLDEEDGQQRQPLMLALQLAERERPGLAGRLSRSMAVTMLDHGACLLPPSWGHPAITRMLKLEGRQLSDYPQPAPQQYEPQQRPATREEVAAAAQKYWRLAAQAQAAGQRYW